VTRLEPVPRFLSPHPTMPILAGIFSKKDKHTRYNSPSKPSSPTPAAAISADGPTIRVVDDGHKARAPTPLTTPPSTATDYVLPEINFLAAENAGFDDATSITASSSCAHPPSSSGNLYTQPVAPSSSKLRLVNPFRRKSPSGESHSESFTPSFLGTFLHSTGMKQ
jgi:hypothetical protein